MKQENAFQLFENKKVRTVWDPEQEKWFISIIDVIAILTESVDANAYWRKLKQRLKAEGNETVTNFQGLKMIALDGKMSFTDVADAEQESKNVAKQGGNIAKVDLKELEAKTGKKVVSSLNAKSLLEANKKIEN